MSKSSSGGSVKIVKIIGGWMAVLRRIEAGRVSWDVCAVGDRVAAEALDRSGFHTKGGAFRYARQAAGGAA